MPDRWPVITRKDRVRDALSWLHTSRAMPVPPTYSGSVIGAEYWCDVLKAVEALGENPDPDALDKLLGNDHMTRARCNECQDVVDIALRLGDAEPNFDFPTIDICLPCLEEAAKHLRQKQQLQDE